MKLIRKYSLNHWVLSQWLPSQAYEHVYWEIQDKEEIDEGKDDHRNPKVPAIVTDPFVEGLIGEVEVDEDNDKTDTTT